MTAGRAVIGLSQHWGTPEKYVTAVRRVFGGAIDLDPCSNEFSIVRAKVEYCLPEHDGLKDSWKYPRIYVNPPYGTDVTRGTRIRDWLGRCEEANRKHGSEVLALVPVATNTRHWKEHVFGAAVAVTFLYDTRLKFLVNGDPNNKGAPMSCAMVYWGAHVDRFHDVFAEHGCVVDLHPRHDRPWPAGSSSASDRTGGTMTARKQVRRRHVKFVQIVAHAQVYNRTTGRSLDTLAALDADGDVWLLGEKEEAKTVDNGDGSSSTTFEVRSVWGRLTSERA